MCCMNDVTVATLVEGVSSKAAVSMASLLYHNSVVCSLIKLPLASRHLLLVHGMVVYLRSGVLSAANWLWMCSKEQQR